MNKYFLIFLISISLLIYTNSAECSTLTKEDTCKEQKGCTWAAANTCSGDDSCITHKDTKDDCGHNNWRWLYMCFYCSKWIM